MTLAEELMSSTGENGQTAAEQVAPVEDQAPFDWQVVVTDDTIAPETSKK